MITFRLRENLTYSDGSPLIAERFRDAMVRQCDPHLETFNVDNLAEVVGCSELHAIALKEDGSPVDAAAYDAEIALVRHTLEQSAEPHWKQYLDAWNQ
jgi:hypothetical protein